MPNTNIPTLTPEQRRVIAEVQRQVARAEPMLAAADKVLREHGGTEPTTTATATATATDTATAEQAVREMDWRPYLRDITMPECAAVTRDLVDVVVPTINSTVAASVGASLLDAIGPQIDIVNQRLLAAVSPSIDFSAITGSFNTASLLGTAPAQQYLPQVAQLSASFTQMVPTIDTTVIAPIHASLLDAVGPRMDIANRRLLAAISPSIDFSAITGQFMPHASAVFEQVLPTIDWRSFGHLPWVTDAAVAYSAMPDALGGIRLPVLADLVRVTDDLRAATVAILGRWTRLGGLGHFLAGLGRRAALSAREDALQGEREAVGQFAHVWLGVKKVTAAVIDAVIAALFDPTWEHDEIELTLENLNRIRRREARREAALVGSKAKSDLRIHSFDIAEGEFPFAVEPLWPPRPDPRMERLEGFAPRIERVLARLKAAERDIALVYAFQEVGWHEAAVECGYDAKKGDSVRRKLDRLGKQFMARQQGADDARRVPVRAGHRLAHRRDE